MNYLEILTVVFIGWVAGAESGSWSCVHPVITKLPPNEQILFQKGLLKTFGRVMPILMSLSLILLISYYIGIDDKNSIAGYGLLFATVLHTTAIMTTVLFNVPVNMATGKWADGKYNSDWNKKRKLWRFFQGYRAIVFVVVFIILVVLISNR